MKSLFLCSVAAFALMFVFGCTGTDDQASNHPTASTTPTVSALGARGVVGAAKVASFHTLDGICLINECDPDREDNTIAPNATQLLWINQHSVNSCDIDNFFYKIFDGPTEVVGFTPLGGPFTGCNEEWFGYLWNAPSADLFKTSKSANLVLYCGNSLTIISGDSFRLVDNGSCVK